MQEYFFYLGHTPELSLKELSILSGKAPKTISPDIVSLKFSHTKASSIQAKLGGIKKIAQKIQLTNKKDLIKDLQSLLLQSSSKNVAISNYSNVEISRDQLIQLKSDIQKTQPVRFLSFQTQDHSLIALRKQQVYELNIIQEENKLKIAKTIWIQNADLWQKRDDKKPYKNISRGMLPPKLARIMVNLATKGKKTSLADPFCGTGTIAIEGLLLGHKVFASDIKSQAVKGTKNNLTWIEKEFDLKSAKFEVAKLDATHLGEKLKRTSAIATEPYLGPLINDKPKITRENLKNQILGIHKLYKGSLKSWFKILPEKGRVVIIFPEFALFGDKHKIPLIDTCENLGYNMLDNIRYQKSDTKVIRNIVILEKHGKNKTSWKN